MAVCSHSDQQKAKVSCDSLFAFWRVLLDELKSQAECSEWAVIEAFWLPRSHHTLLPSELNLAAPQLSILPADCNWKRECKCAPPLMMCFFGRKKIKTLLLSCLWVKYGCWYFRTVWSPVACRGRIFYIHFIRSTRTISPGGTRTSSTLSSTTTQVQSVLPV